MLAIIVRREIVKDRKNSEKEGETKGGLQQPQESKDGWVTQLGLELFIQNPFQDDSYGYNGL